MTDPELAMLRRLAKADHQVFHAGPGFAEQLELLVGMEKVGWVALETEPRSERRKRAKRRYRAAAVRITGAGRDALNLLGG